MRKPIPESLGPSFTTAAAMEAGVSRSRLRAADLERPFHGVRALREHPSDDAVPSAEQGLLRRVHQYAHRMTQHEFFTHVAAAVMWGLPLPAGIVSGRQVDVGVFAPRRNTAGAGALGHAVAVGLAHIVDHPVWGFPVTTPASTWAMLGSVLKHPYDVVAVTDAVLREPMHSSDPPPLASRAQLDAALLAGRRVGIGRLREALPLGCTRAASRPESWMRMIIVDAGLPLPSANHEVYDRGVWIARVDLAYPAQRIAIEYEGEHHLKDPARVLADIARIERLIDAGWRVLRVTKADVFRDPVPFLGRLRRALARH